MSREATKISELSSKDLLEKYEYFTGEDLRHKPRVFEKAKFEYHPLGMTKQTKIKHIIKTNKTNTWFIIHYIVLQSLNILMDLKTCHLILCTKD